MAYISFLIFTAVTAFVQYKFFEVQPSPYMDEIFHVPQAQKFCKGNFFEWDSKITTLPGLYLLSVGILKPISLVLDKHLCNILHLRIINAVFAAGNLYIIYCILRLLAFRNKGSYNVKLDLTTLAVSTFPTLFFFTFLYYTDAGSTFFVLLSYLLHLQQRPWLSGLMGALSVLMRQTNIVWVFFIMADQLVTILTQHVTLSKRVFKKIDHGSLEYVKVMVVETWNMARQWKRLSLLLKDVWVECGMYIMVIFNFLVFVFWNKGIVVGDRTAHQAKIHVPQVFYCAAFILMFASPYLVTLTRIKQFVKFVWKRKMLTVTLLTAMFCAVHFNTLAHPYLLADNRHYTFYLWRKIFMRNEFSKYLLIPVYFYSLWAMSSELYYKNALWKLAFVITLVVATVFQVLLECRYFILPYLFFRFHVKPGNFKQTILELLISTVVNAATIYLFVTHYFKWENSREHQRFMW